MVYLTFLSLLSDDLMSLLVDLKHVLTKHFRVVASNVQYVASIHVYIFL